MKKLFSIFGLLALFLFSVQQVFAQTANLVPMLAVCRLDNGQIEVTLGAQALSGSEKISAVEGHILLTNMTYASEEYGGNVNLPTTTETLTTGEERVVTTTGLVNYFDVSSTQPTAFYKLIGNVVSGAQTIRAKVDLDGTSVYPGSNSVALDPLSLHEDAGVQVYEASLVNVPFCEPKCGNGAVENGEECDDGNTSSGDGCSSTCKKEVATTTTTDEPTTTNQPESTTTTTTTNQPESTTQVQDLTGATILPSATQQDTTVTSQAVTTDEISQDVVDETALHGAPVVEPQPVQLRNAASLQETGPAENALIVVLGLAFMWTLYRFRHLFQK